MKRASLVLCLAAVGCGDDTPKKKDLVVPVDGGGVAASTAYPEKPAKTDPTAEAVIRKMLVAHSGGSPDRISGLKTHGLKRSGVMNLPNATPAVWTVAARWPEQYRTQAELEKVGLSYLLVRNGPAGWKATRGAVPAPPEPAAPIEYDDMVSETFGEWCVLLVPFLDPAARVAVSVPGVPVGGKETNGVRVWVGPAPPANLYTDAGTGVLLRVEIEAKQLGGITRKGFDLGDYKPTNGVLLPNTIDYSHNGVVKASWKSSVVEFPKTLAADLFEKP